MEKIKKYSGNDMNEILDRIKVELGHDAIILQSSAKNSGIGGQNKIEVVAGINEPKAWDANPGRYFNPKPAKLAVQSLLNEFRSVSTLPKKTKEPIKPEKENPLPESQNIMNEIKELKFLINTILPVSQFNEPEAIRKLRSHLMNNGAEINTANELINIMKNLLEDKISKIDFNQSIHIAKTLIEKQFNKKTYNNDLQQKRVKIVVGPTGAGKTTTLAKLASQAVFEYKKHVILISLDSYRLGAHAQLKSYAEILSVPFYTINTPEDLKKVVKIIPQNTEIFVDTSGISPMDGIKIKNMAGFTNGIEDASISLVVSANHQIQQMESIFARFRVTGYNNIILTKIDELNTFGHLLSLMKSQVHNFSYLTNGQEVPKDIMLFSSSFLSDKILQVV